MHAQVAVRRLEELLEIVEAHGVGGSERAEDSEANAFVNESIERQWPLDLGLSAHGTERVRGRGA
jgi:hypothetical protein